MAPTAGPSRRLNQDARTFSSAPVVLTAGLYTEDVLIRIAGTRGGRLHGLKRT